MSKETRRIILAVTGASGMPYSETLLRALAAMKDVETHLIISDAANKVLALESATPVSELKAMADICHDPEDVGAAPASGSWIHHGMVVCPCSMASLAAMAQGLASNLIHRAADVTLKEGRPLIVVPRETPLNRIHLKNMLALHDAGAAIIPACPGFYHQPRTIQDLADQFAARILDRLGLEHGLGSRWAGE